LVEGLFRGRNISGNHESYTYNHARHSGHDAEGDRLPIITESEAFVPGLRRAGARRIDAVNDLIGEGPEEFLRRMFVPLQAQGILHFLEVLFLGVHGAFR
jgi:hypothetical protein